MTGQRSRPNMPDHGESECTAINGFPTGTMEEIRDRSQELIIEGNYYLYNNTILIPEMKFICSGTVVQVIVGGVRLIEMGNQSMKLQIWRQNKTESGRYFRIDEIALPSACKMNKLVQSSSVSRMFRDIAYDCILKHSSRSVTVKSGDILGIELPPEHIADFELYSLTECMVSNLIFESNLPSTIDLHSGDVENAAQPLIRILVNGIGLLS